MEDTMASAYPLVMTGVVALIAVLAFVMLFVQLRPKAFAPVPLALNATSAVAVFVLLYALGGIDVNWLFAAVFAVVGAGLGFVTGRTSKVSVGPKGKPVVRRAVAAPVVSAASYVLAAAMAAWGTGGLFSVALLVVALGAAMQVGANVAEMMLSAPSAASPAPVVDAPA